MSAKLKIGMLGVRHVHAEGLAQIFASRGCEIVGATEDDPLAASAWSSLDLGPVVDRTELFARCDAIVVAGTNARRVDDTLAAVDAGLPVLSEKPIACNAESLRRIAGSDRAHEQVMLALPLRFSRVLQRAKQAIAAGDLGTPIAGRGTNHGVYPGGWFGDPAEAGGGAVMDHTPHVSDALCWLLSDRIEEVYCETGTYLNDIPVDDCGVLTMGFHSGFFASLDASWSRPTSFHTWGDVWIQLFGSEGRFVIDPLTSHLKLYDNAAGKLRTIDYGDDMTRSMCDAFIEFAGGNVPSPVPLADGVHASEVILAAYASAAQHQPERVGLQPISV